MQPSRIVTLLLGVHALTIPKGILSTAEFVSPCAVRPVLRDTLSMAGCADHIAQGDTSRPRLPKSAALPDDSTRTLPSPFGTAERYYRDIVGVMFDDTTSGRTIRAIMTKYHAVIVAGGVASPHPVYYLQVPDPGRTYAAIDSLARAIRSESGVFSTYVPQWRGRLKLRSRGS